MRQLRTQIMEPEKWAPDKPLAGYLDRFAEFSDTGQLLDGKHYHGLVKSEDPWDEVLLATINQLGQHITVGHSRRGGVTRLIVDSEDKLCRGDTGKQFGIADAYTVNWGTPDAYRLNPTKVGAIRKPDALHVNGLQFAPMTFFRHNIMGDSVITEDCTIPPHFDPLGYEHKENLVPGLTLQSGKSPPVLLPEMRMYHRLTTNVNGVAGLHHSVSSTYFPFDFMGSGVQCHTGHGLWLLPRYSSFAKIYNLDTMAQIDLRSDFGTDNDFVQNDRGVWEVKTQMSRSRGVKETRSDAENPMAYQLPMVEDGQVMAVILSGPDGALGLMVQLHHNNDGLTKPTTLSVSQIRNSDMPIGLDEQNTTRIRVSSERATRDPRIVARKSGWATKQHHFAFGKDMEEVLWLLRTERDRAREPVVDVPREFL